MTIFALIYMEIEDLFIYFAIIHIHSLAGKPQQLLPITAAPIVIYGNNLQGILNTHNKQYLNNSHHMHYV